MWQNPFYTSYLFILWWIFLNTLDRTCTCVFTIAWCLQLGHHGFHRMTRRATLSLYILLNMWILIFQIHLCKLKTCVILIQMITWLKVRAGVEMALIDAAANSIGIPLWRLFGGVSSSISTDITVKTFPFLFCFSWQFTVNFHLCCFPSTCCHKQCSQVTTMPSNIC